MANRDRLEVLYGGKNMKTNAIKVKPIRAFDVIKEEKFIKEIKMSLFSKPNQNSITKNDVALSMLKKARMG